MDTMYFEWQHPDWGGNCDVLACSRCGCVCVCLFVFDPPCLLIGPQWKGEKVLTPSAFMPGGDSFCALVLSRCSLMRSMPAGLKVRWSLIGVESGGWGNCNRCWSAGWLAVLVRSQTLLDTVKLSVASRFPFRLLSSQRNQIKDLRIQENERMKNSLMTHIFYVNSNQRSSPLYTEAHLNFKIISVTIYLFFFFPLCPAWP